MGFVAPQHTGPGGGGGPLACSGPDFCVPRVHGRQAGRQVARGGVVRPLPAAGAVAGFGPV